MEQLEKELMNYFGVEVKPISDKDKKFYRVSVEDCLNFAKQAVNSRLEEMKNKITEAWDENSGYNSGICDGLDLAEEIINSLKTE